MLTDTLSSDTALPSVTILLDCPVLADSNGCTSCLSLIASLLNTVSINWQVINITGTPLDTLISNIDTIGISFGVFPCPGSGAGIIIVPDPAQVYSVKLTGYNHNGQRSVTDTISLFLPTEAGNVALRDFSIYPNPADNSITVSTGSLGLQSYMFNRFNIYDALGQLVAEQNVSPLYSSFTVNINNLAAGIYTLRGIDSNKVPYQLGRFVKQ